MTTQSIKLIEINLSFCKQQRKQQQQQQQVLFYFCIILFFSMHFLLLNEFKHRMEYYLILLYLYLKKIDQVNKMSIVIFSIFSSFSSCSFSCLISCVWNRFEERNFNLRKIVLSSYINKYSYISFDYQKLINEQKQSFTK